MSASVRAAAVVRSGLGLAMLTQPREVARLLGAPLSGRHTVLRVLGLRHIAQAGVLAYRPQRATATASCFVDGTHVLSCLLLAAAAPPRRTPALRDAAVESGVLLMTWLGRP
ncbi:MAG: hypothetical protein QOE84_85 [Actinomycetota bacterium]|nr:hypothetical protein [Actinomycetota bacterium]